MTDEKAGAMLFPSTNRDELGRTIDFLKDLVGVIGNLYVNGCEPVLGKCDFTRDKNRVRASVEEVLRKLARLRATERQSKRRTAR